MRTVLSFSILLLFCSLLFSSSSYFNLDHQVHQAIIGEPLKLEISNLNNTQAIYDARVFYRTSGMADYKSIEMRQKGFLFSANVPTNKMDPGEVEYYFAFQTAGSINYYPEESPELNPFHVSLLASGSSAQQQGGGMDIILLSPELDEIISPDDFMIAISIPVTPEEMNNYRFSLFLGGVDQSDLLELDGNLIMFSPKMIRGGLHNAEFKVFDQNDQVVGEKSFSFQISAAPSTNKGLNARTSLFMDNRYHSISENSENLFRGGLSHTSSYQKLDFQALILVSSEESYDRQPVNQYGGQMRYNFTPTMNLYLKGGDFSTNYDQLVFWEKRVRGIGIGYSSKFFDLDFTYGQTKKGVEGKAAVDSTQSQTNGTYKQSFMAIQPTFKYDKYFSWGFNLVNGKDDVNSIQYGGNAKEALVLGTTIGLNLHKNRIQFSGSVQASMKNEDAVGEVDFDSLAEDYDIEEGSEKDAAEALFNFLDDTGFLTLSQGLSPLPSVAMKFQTQLKYLNQVFQFTYKNIDAEYTTPGNPYLLKDIRGFYIKDKIRLISNQLFLNLYFNSYEDRISQGDGKTNNAQYGATISYYPFNNLPGVSITYGKHNRENGLAEDGLMPDTTIFQRIEDTETQRINFSTSYKFVTGSVKNNATISYSNYTRDDNIYKDLFAYKSTQSEFNIFTIGIRNQFSFPLISKISFSTNSILYGKMDETRNLDFRTDTDINKINLGLSYKLYKIYLNGDLMPFVNFNHQTIKTTRPVVNYQPTYPEIVTTTKLDYTRLNYSFGFNFQTAQYGVFTFRFDYYDYSDVYDWNDSILSTGYELNF
ncbi:MAG: hypothetical protein P8Y99_00225 [Calditrichaceae bacterium]